MKWVLKAAIQNIICVFPYPQKVNYLLQRIFTVGAELPEAFVIDRINHAQNHLSSFKKNCKSTVSDIKILEIGTGHYPVVPIALFLSGANSVETTDIQKLYNLDSIRKTIRAFISLNKKRALKKLIPLFQEDRMEILIRALTLKTNTAIFDLLNIKSTICNYKEIPIKTDSIDLIVSNNTLQFIEENTLHQFFIELKRVSKINAVLSFFIDFTDEYSHFDSTISKFNFYRFTKNEWQMLSNELYSANRLRYVDFKRILEELNLYIIDDEIIKGDVAEIKGLKLSPGFQIYNQNDLLIKYVRFVLLNPK